MAVLGGLVVSYERGIPVNGASLPADPRLPLSSEPGSNEPVKAILWPWLEPFSVRTSFNPIKLFLSLSAAVSQQQFTKLDHISFSRRTILKLTS